MTRDSLYRDRSGGVAALVVVLVLTATATTEASPPVPQSSELDALRQELRQLREDYERRLAELESRLAALEVETRETAEQPRDDELAALRAAARQAAGTTDVPSPITTPTVGRPVVGHERNLNRLNPEISFTGDVLGVHGGSDQDFDAREFELDLQAALDPFSTTKWTLAFEEEEVEIEEGYVRYDGLPGGLSLRAGKMRQTFGALNRYHLHALPQTEYPLVYQSYFASEGLVQTGLSLDWLMPRPWASANELTLQLTDGSSEPFGGDSFDRLAGLLHLKNFWDVSPSTWFEWGLSGISGRPADDRHTEVWGSDLTLHWQPPARAKYREITWRTEVLFSRRDDELGLEREAWGGYTYLEGLLRRNLYAGVRFDAFEDPLDPAQEFRAVEPYIGWWQSEFVRLRLSYQSLTDELIDDTEHKVRLQLTWSAGPHKHESY